MRALDRFIYDSGRGPLYGAAIVMIALLSSSLAMDVANGDAWQAVGFDSRLELVGQGIMPSILIPTLFFALAYMQRYSVGLAREIAASDAELTSLPDAIRLPPVAWILAGAGFGFIYANLFNTPNYWWERLSTWTGTEYWMIFVQNLLWQFVAISLVFRLHTASRFAEAGRTVPIDLFEQSNLRFFTRNGLADVLVFMGCFCLTPLQAMDATFRYQNYLWGLIVVVPAATILFVMPMWSIHQRLKRLIREARFTINEMIRQRSKSLDDDAIATHELLLQRRDRIDGVRTWPVDFALLLRLVFYLVIPPLAWIGAAIVEVLVEQYLP